MQIPHDRLTSRMEVGKSYRRQDGQKVTVLLVKNDLKDYETVLCDDARLYVDKKSGKTLVHPVHRYNRSNYRNLQESRNDLGRVTGSDHDFSDPYNIVGEWVDG